MSGVLDRMAQRALGTLPAAQPLVTPRYAESRAEPYGHPAPEMNVGLETIAETEAIAPIRPLVDEARKPFAAVPDIPARQRNEKSDVSPEARKPGGRFTSSRPIAKASEPGAILPQPAHAAASQALPIKPLSPPEAGRSRDGEVEVRSAQGSMQSRAQTSMQATNRSGKARMPKTVPHFEPLEPRREIAKAAPMREMRETAAEKREAAAIASAPSLKDASSRHETVRSLESPKSSRAIAAPPPPIADRRAMPQAERQVAEEKSEVHISIGNIELRAPRPEPRPAAAPFRPRVSLDDFLRRAQETRS